MSTSPFDKDKLAGQTGEFAVGQICNSGGCIVEVLTAVKGAQKDGVDYLVTKGKVSYSLEVKTDSKNTGNVYLEVISHGVEDGCFITSKARYWAYVLTAINQILLIPVVAARTWLLESGERFEVKACGRSQAKGRIVPIKVLLAEVRGVKLYDYVPATAEETVEFKGKKSRVAA